MKMTLEITDLNEARAILAAISCGEKPSTSAAQAAPTPATAPAPAASVPTPVALAVPVTPPAPAPVPMAPSVQAPVPVAPPTGPVPTSAPTYTVDQIAAAGASLMDAGKQPQLIALLGQFGAQAITQLRPDQLGAFATALRSLGAQI